MPGGSENEDQNRSDRITTEKKLQTMNNILFLSVRVIVRALYYIAYFRSFGSLAPPSAADSSDYESDT